MRRTLCAGVAALACGFSISIWAANSAIAAPVAMPVPVADHFFAAPAHLEAAEPGDVLRARQMPPPFAVVADVTQLMYRSTDSLGRPIAATATVLSPVNHRPDNPVLVYQHSINSLGLRCAPSQAMWSTDPNVRMNEAPVFDVALAMGWTVVLPDHLGPRAAYGAARMGGQITLDAIRATQRHQPLALTNSPITMAGYSGGGMATAWAAALAPSYAPDLHISGAAIGGVPANLETMAEALGHHPHPAFGIAAAVAFGLEREYGDQLPISDYLTDEGRRFRGAINDACVNEILALGAGRSVAGLGTSFDLFFQPQTRAILRDNSVQFAPAPAMPIYEWHSGTDPLLPLADLDATMARWRAEGTPLTTVLTPAPEHLSAAVIGMPAAVQWLAGLVSSGR
ncbi:lipase family protein [Nocardia asiatica]|uniref:lipase family protein n=1 Tax=Nocardia asiatica TaxID=209252 RepID=UPI0002E80BAD|nr:lipase family protein [Nocardia asiatica]